MTWNDLGDMHDEGSPVTIFRLNVLILPVTRCLRVFWMVFVQKRRLSIFSHWLMERSQNWPDLSLPISKSPNMPFIYTCMDIDIWKFQGDRSFGDDRRAFKLFLRCGDLTWSGDLTLSYLGLKFSHVRNRCMNRCAKNLRGGGGGGSKVLSKVILVQPSPAWVNVVIWDQLVRTLSYAFLR